VSSNLARHFTHDEGHMTRHHLQASAATCHCGFFDATLSPRLTIASGDVVTIDTLTGTLAMLATAPGHTPPELSEVRRQAESYPAPHILTGPVAVEGALPGDVLQVDILDVALRQDWGFNLIRPLGGTLPDRFPDERLLLIPIDREAATATLPFGVTLPLRPFFGIMGVAPPDSWGRITSVIPRAHGGNIDNRELVAGTTLFLPVHVAGALFSCGDGHGCQGDGEVCLTALETALTGTFRLTVRRDMSLRLPRAETATHLISMGFDPDLDRALEIALGEMIDWLGRHHRIEAADAYTLASLACDFRVTQTVNGAKGVHGMLAKALLP
jgi:acetamidase/formamidase